ncbi:GntR family transcriptional regulator [Echinicola sp. 20G]|uniref:GntR family transcriptional regulator n=1 Tax=Echinicola sp. 20G TaxID=2781961 RepID=UPI001910F328|nr:GntR family transcriptional regulator [Echinicola sp. 20G]
MSPHNFIRISSESRVPKYRQIINSITEDVSTGKLEKGRRIPSINELSEQYYISRDTVEKAYKYLKNEGIIESQRSKGYYISNVKKKSAKKILFLLNKFSDYKLKVYKSFISELGPDVNVEFYVYHCDQHLFVNKVNESLELYDKFIVMPHFKDSRNIHINSCDEVQTCLNKIPSNKLIFMDNKIEKHDENSVVYQDFMMDIYYSLCEGREYLEKYKKIILVFPSNNLYPHPQEIKIGFKKFCIEFSYNYEIIDSIDEEIDLMSGDCFIAVQENHLVGIISQIKDGSMTLGKEIGIISYNDTPLKKLLGISVVTTDFEAMGVLGAAIVKGELKGAIKNNFKFINRGSA